MAALATEAALLDTTERRRRVGDERTVEADHARFKCLAEAQPTLQISGVHIGDQAILGGVRELTASSSASKTTTGATGPKISSRRIAASRGNIDENRRRIEEPRPRRRPPDGDACDRRAQRRPRGHHLLETGGVDQRAELRALLESRADTSEPIASESCR